MQPRSILLLAYKYPPYKGVAAQRWRIMTRYLVGLGHRLDVLTVDWEGLPVPRAVVPEGLPGLTVHTLPSGYPHRLVRRHVTRPWQRVLRNRTAMLINRARYWDDEAQRWGRHVTAYARALYATKPWDVIIATGAPFQTMRWACEIQAHTGKPLILDFRDPWFGDPAKRLKPGHRHADQIYAWQAHCVQQATAVVSVTRGLQAELQVHDQQSAKFHLIYNGYDPAALPADVLDSNRAKTWDFVYAGTINSGREKPADAFLKSVARLRESGREIRVMFAGSVNHKMLPHWQPYVAAGWLELWDAMPQSRVFDQLRASRFALYFGTDDLPYALSTKIYEYGGLQVPVVAVHYGGEIEGLIQEHDLGYSINLGASAIDAELTQALSETRTFRLDVAPFAYPNLAAQYSALIEGL